MLGLAIDISVRIYDCERCILPACSIRKGVFAAIRCDLASRQIMLIKSNCKCLPVYLRSFCSGRRTGLLQAGNKANIITARIHINHFFILTTIPFCYCLHLNTGHENFQIYIYHIFFNHASIIGILYFVGEKLLR